MKIKFILTTAALIFFYKAECKLIESIYINKRKIYNCDEIEDGDHRLTLRIPKSLLAKIDKKRRERIGSISRNLWILEVIDKATRKV